MICSVEGTDASGKANQDVKYDKPYSIQEAYFPLSWIHKRGKFWPPVGRINNVIGDRKPIFETEYEDF